MFGMSMKIETPTVCEIWSMIYGDIKIWRDMIFERHYIIHLQIYKDYKGEVVSGSTTWKSVQHFNDGYKNLRDHEQSK